MKKLPAITFLLLSIVISPNLILAQGWTLINPKPTFQDLYSVSFPSADTGYIAGSHATLLRTVDGGISWKGLNFPVDGAQIRNLYFTGLNTGYIAYGRSIYRTQDAGETWEAHNLPYAWSIADRTDFLNDSIGFAFGDRNLIAKTTNSGQDWQLISFNFDSNYLISSVKFANPQTGYLAGWESPFREHPVFRRSDDGGLNWRNIAVPSEIRYINDLEVIGPEEVWIGAGNAFNWTSRMYHSLDGGFSWTAVDIGLSNSSEAILRINFFDEMEGRVLNASHIYSTTDGGQTWSDSNISFNNSNFSRFNDFSWPSPDISFMAGTGPALAKTYDGGQSFENMISEHNYTLWCIFMQDSLTGCTGGYNNAGCYIARTSDGGYSWEEAEIDIPYFSNQHNQIYDIKFSSPSIGWAASIGNILYKTVDGGHYWTSLPTNMQQVGFNYLSTPTPNSIFAAGKSGTIYKSHDQGETWQNISPVWPVEFEIEKNFLFTDTLTGFVVIRESDSDIHKFLKTNDGGVSWDELSYSPAVDIHSISFFDKLNGMLSLSDKSVNYTSDGGLSWQESSTQLNRHITYLQMFSSQDGIACDNGDFLAVTSDGGLTFETVYQGSSGWSSIHNSHFHNKSMGLACGENGMIMRYDQFITDVPFNDLNQMSETVEPFFNPNPAHNRIFLKDNNYEFLSISDLQGRLVYFQNNTGNITLDISDLNPGLYLVNLSSAKGYRQQKLIKL